jgi:hypothetical protein
LRTTGILDIVEPPDACDVERAQDCCESQEARVSFEEATAALADPEHRLLVVVTAYPVWE